MLKRIITTYLQLVTTIDQDAKITSPFKALLSAVDLSLFLISTHNSAN